MLHVSRQKIVCFGGGTGLPALLKSLKQNPFFSITAVVNMFDSGGSSGVLRDQHGILPPGDIQKCLVALAKHEEAASDMFLSRIPDEAEPLHTGGNLLLKMLGDQYKDYYKAIAAYSYILSIQGHRVLPVSIDNSELGAIYTDNTVATSETEVDNGMRGGKEITKLFLQPEPQASSHAIEAIINADIICIGPGSFYTSLLPNFLPTGIKEAFANTNAPIVYIANLVTEGDGMPNTGISYFVSRIEAHIGRHVSLTVVNNRVPNETILQQYEAEGKLPILNTDELDNVIVAPLWNSDIARHDPVVLRHIFSGISIIAQNRTFKGL